MSDVTMPSPDDSWQTWLNTPPDERPQSYYSTEDVFKAGFAACAAVLGELADQFAQYAGSDRNEARSKKDDDPDRHYWDGCADANAGRADDVRAAHRAAVPEPEGVSS